MLEQLEDLPDHIKLYPFFSLRKERETEAQARETVDPISIWFANMTCHPMERILSSLTFDRQEDEKEIGG